MTMSLAEGVAEATNHPERLVDGPHNQLSPCRAQNEWEELNWAIPVTSCIRSVAGGFSTSLMNAF